jgi:hypothetical protein
MSQFLRSVLPGTANPQEISMDSDLLAMLIVIPLVCMLFAALLVGLVFVIRDTIRKRGNMGVNFKRTSCPLCDEPAPVVRFPKTWRQFLWGGCTCARCGLEYDKWGRPVDQREWLRRLDERDDRPRVQPLPPRGEASDAIQRKKDEIQ